MRADSIQNELRILQVRAYHWLPDDPLVIATPDTASTDVHECVHIILFANAVSEGIFFK
jgi:hypothetical protein